MGNNLLRGKRGIIFGALNDQSIAWKTAEHAAAEGARFVLTNTPVGMRFGTINELAEKYKGRDSYSEIYKAIKKVSESLQ